MATLGLKSLYYITHVENLDSILGIGILSHRRIDEEGIQTKRVYDKDIVQSRRHRRTPDGQNLWDFANLFFQPRNPMLYRVIHEHTEDEIAILAVRPAVLHGEGVYVSDGNAASPYSLILGGTDGLRLLPQIIRDAVERDSWSRINGSKRTIMAECLVPNAVPPDVIETIYVATEGAKQKLEYQHAGWPVPIVVEPKMFFRPCYRTDLTERLSLIRGDMFFSQLQTLTISVNCVGVMGKGLASRAKYQFPDVYVFYQDLCRKRSLRMGKPHLYKREASYDYELADEPSPLYQTRDTWFLLFPTKHHWRERSDLAGIERGLEWLQDAYRDEGIQSLAMPALGCGLGRLQWADVGPLMCRYLSALDIQVWVYLPAERQVIAEQLTKQYLLAAD